ncbi:MAG: hypothetical protein ACOCZ5_01875 [bacterium]
MEIEKKFIVDERILRKHIPDYQKYSYKEIYQKYIAVTDDEEIRIRLTQKGCNKKYLITHKKGKGNIREEKEFEIGIELAKKIWENIDDTPINKIRYYIPYKNKTIELDIFINTTLKAFAEIEFDTIEEMNNFEFPAWFGKETKLKNKDIYKNIQEGLYKREIRYS